MSGRQATSADRLIAEVDHALRTLAGPARTARSSPADGEDPELSPEQARLSARLMRINHAGEVAAQALYRGQAALARDPALRERLLAAAAEEQDHLGWCAGRLAELGHRPSRFDPLWYAGAFTLGALASLAGDRVSLGFLAETEQQVARHLDDHLERLPDSDSASRRVLERMRSEELAHREAALDDGGLMLPAPVRHAMWAASRVMTTLSGWR
ncbi:MAG: 2-polyprenyl-3-methyl-6-methoxy-1,4-benzoquinone monooxygenase [Chromatiales bacterium]|nr:2-polyprenyl-3-methyl-6-methoxy-1,4-benzoquinone monooxygenase [Chromatiales bacterium]